MCAGAAVQVDIRNAVNVVGPGEQPGVRGIVASGKCQAGQAGTRKGNDVDAVAVVVERRLVEQRRANRVSSMDHAAVRRVAERVADRRNVCAAPLADSKALRNLLRDEVSEDRELAVEVVVDANDLFPQIRGRVVAADKRGLSVGIYGIAGKIPAFSRAVAFGAIMQDGILLPGNG